MVPRASLILHDSRSLPMSTSSASFSACLRHWSIALCRFVTVFSGSPNVDVLVAPPEVIAALPGMTPAALNDFLKQRPTLPRDLAAIAAALGPAQASATIPKSKSFRVLTTLKFDNGRRTSSEVVIALGDDKDKTPTMCCRGRTTWKPATGRGNWRAVDDR